MKFADSNIVPKSGDDRYNIQKNKINIKNEWYLREQSQSKPRHVTKTKY
jgi:hypothetical protein